MSDPFRADGSRALAAASEADRDAKIELLLLAGLDHYFAAQYDYAIGVWPRLLLLDRNHAPRRAYCERARAVSAAESSGEGHRRRCRSRARRRAAAPR